MTSFVHTDYPRNHAGLERVGQSFSMFSGWFRRAGTSRALASVLVAGGAAAAIVVADQIVTAWADGHLLLAWIAMWVIVFALLAWSADTIGRLPRVLRSRYARWKQAGARRAADDRTWQAAIADPRVMADLQAARLRAEREAHDAGQPTPAWPFLHMPGASYRQDTWLS